MPTVRYLLLVGALFLATQAMAADEADRPWKRVIGPALQSAFNNVELGDGTHYSYRFHADGRFDGTELGKDIRGTWRASALELCWQWIRPTGGEECYTVERKGREMRGARNGFEAWSGEVRALKRAAK